MTNPDPVELAPQTAALQLTHAAIRTKIAGARRVVITSHIRPDGDAVGSLLGLGLAILKTGRKVRMVLADGVPTSFHHLEGSRLIERGSLNGELRPDDLLIVVDVSDYQRIGGVFGERVPDLNIDHHVTNPGFAGTNLVLPEQAATCAIVAGCLEDWGLSFDRAIASALLTGIITDTIGYRTSNMTPGILRISARLMEHGADLPFLYTRALLAKSYEAARYWGQGLDQLQREEVAGGRSFIWTILTLADRAAAGYTGNDDADLVNFLSGVDADLVVLINEQKNGHVKVSWRARAGIDVSQIALKFGGGGHVAAAGADIPGTLEHVQEQVLQETRKALGSITANNNGLA